MPELAGCEDEAMVAVVRQASQTSWRSWQQVWFGMAIITAAAVIAILWGNTRSSLSFVLGCVAVLCFIAFLDWRAGILLLIGMLTAEDLIRKYLGNNMLIYFCKDVIYIAALFSFLLASRQQKVQQPYPSLHPPFLPFLAIFLAYATIQTFNPNSPSPLYGLIGFRMNFFYLPLLWPGFFMWQSPKDLGRFWTFCLLLASVVAILGIIQSIVGLDFLNPPTLAEEIRPLAYLVRQAPITGYQVPRPCSVFVSDGRFGHFMLLCLTLGLGICTALWLYHEWWKNWLDGWQRIVLVLGTALCGVALFMVGSRGGFVFGSITVLTMLAATRWEATAKWIRQFYKKILLRMVLALGLVFAIIWLAAPEALKARWAFYWETLSPWSPSSELVARVFRYHPQNFIIALSSPYALFGQGFGTNSLGIQYLRKFINVPPPHVIVESGIGNIVAEVGIIGLTLWLLWAFATIWSVWRLFPQLRHTPFAPIAVSIGWYAVIKIIGPLWGGMAGFQEFIGNAFLWLLLGILFRLPYLADTYRFGRGVP